MHESYCFTESLKINRERVLKRANLIANQRGDYQNQISRIRWLDNVSIFEDENEAREYVYKQEMGNYDCFAVRYYHYDSLKESSTSKKLKQRINSLNERLMDIERVVYAQTLTSAHVGCKNCDSKIATKFLKSNYCPVCRKDIRPKTTKDRIENIKKRIKETEADLKNENRLLKEKNRKKAEVRWLIKIEYHC